MWRCVRKIKNKIKSYEKRKTKKNTPETPPRRLVSTRQTGHRHRVYISVRSTPMSRWPSGVCIFGRPSARAPRRIFGFMHRQRKLLFYRRKDLGKNSRKIHSSSFTPSAKTINCRIQIMFSPSPLITSVTCFVFLTCHRYFDVNRTHQTGSVTDLKNRNRIL